jgi:GntR family transcriptional regulator
VAKPLKGQEAGSMVEARVSIYQGVINNLRERIRGEEFQQGNKFLTEREIAAQYKVSRPTANKILTSLVSEGALAFRKGVGTFVSGDALKYDLRRLVSFTDKAQAAGKKPETKVLKFETVEAERAGSEICSRLNVQSDEKLFYFERLRIADRKPVILEWRYVPARFCPKLSARDLSGSLYELWIQRYGLVISGAEQSIQAVNLTPADAKLLRVRARTAALRVVAVGFLESREPLWHEVTTYRSDAYEFQTCLGGVSSSRPTVGRFSEIRAK